MELIRENVRMLKVKSKASSQLTYDEDYNVPDAKPDIGRMIQSRGEVLIDEVRMGEGSACIAGVLEVRLLYVSEEKNPSVHSLLAKLPIENTIYLEGIQSGDKMCLNWEIEDVSLHIINSRKMNIKAILTFHASVDEMKELALPVRPSEETVSSRKKEIRILSLTVHKKDTLRLKEEITLASNKPNIEQLVWDTVEVRGMDIRTEQDRLSVKGEMFAFVLYCGDGGPLQWLEHSLPFHQSLECPGVTADMISNVQISQVQHTMDVKPDADGEERIISVEVVLELQISVYEERQLQLLLDVYTPGRNLCPVVKKEMLESLLVRNFSKCRINEKIQAAKTKEKILQICHSQGTVKIDRAGVVRDGIYVEGIVQVKVLYIVSDDKMPFYSMEAMLPFSHTVEAVGIETGSIYHLRPNLEQLSTTMLDSNEVEVKALLNLNALVINQREESIIEAVEQRPWDREKIQSMPGITVYMVQPEDSLWEIAKNFYTTVEDICAMNHLENEKIHPYQPLLLVKKVENQEKK